MKKLLFLFVFASFFSCVDDGNDFPKVVPYPEEDPKPSPEKPDVAGVEKYTVFNAGDDGIHSYRIPSVCTTRKGTLLAFAEGRTNSWKDRTHTNIVCKRSEDNGKHWSEIKVLTDLPKDSRSAYISPSPVVDMETGDIFLFFVDWKVGTDGNGTGNEGYMMMSSDDGLNWTQPKNMTEEILTQNPYPGTSDMYHFIYGFGPGSGLQMQGGDHKGRLIVPCSQSYLNTKKKAKKSNVTVYSDDHGMTWHAGDVSYWYAEYQIAESPLGNLVTNMRGSKKTDDGKIATRGSSVSRDYGITWSDWDPKGSLIYYDDLVTPAGGCQGSVLGDDKNIYYSGPAGVEPTSDTDDRGLLYICKGVTDLFGTTKWGPRKQLYDKASGYSCITQLKDGRLGILFEAGDEVGFLKTAERPNGWMRLDFVILPKF